MDANDESLARWKASLGITGEGGGDPTKRKVCPLSYLLGSASLRVFVPKVEVLTLELTSPSLPAGRTISVDLNNPNQLAQMKDSPIQVKEGAEYRCVVLDISSGYSVANISPAATSSLKLTTRLSPYVRLAPLVTVGTETGTSGITLHPSSEARSG